MTEWEIAHARWSKHWDEFEARLAGLRASFSMEQLRIQDAAGRLHECCNQTKTCSQQGAGCRFSKPTNGKQRG